MNSFNFQLEKTIDQLNKNLNTGDKLEFNIQSISITLEKVSSKNITGKHLIQSNGAKIRFPQLNINKSVIINVIKLLFSLSKKKTNSFFYLVDDFTIFIDCFINLT